MATKRNRKHKGRKYKTPFRSRGLNKNRSRSRKNLVGGSFFEVGSIFTHVLNNVASTFTVPIPSSVSFDPRVTNQFIYQK